VSRIVKYAGFGWNCSSNGVAEPSLPKTPGTQEYLSVKPHTVYEMQCRTSRQARSSVAKPSAWACTLMLSAGRIIRMSTSVYAVLMPSASKRRAFCRTESGRPYWSAR